MMGPIIIVLVLLTLAEGFVQRENLLTTKSPVHSSPLQKPLQADTHAIDQRSRYKSECEYACRILKHSYPEAVVQWEDKGYWDEKRRYFSRQQGRVNPCCFFTPSSEEQISDAVQLARQTGCHFSVKSGGHGTFEGASNVVDGLTIVMKDFRTVQRSIDHRTVRTGTGNSWHDVYVALEQENVTVTGGRTGSVGVGGLVLGGGISFFSGIHGFATDNIANFKVVLADGAVVNANYTSRRDLYWALRGGGNNFGIVTEIDMYSIPHHLMWGGIRNYTSDSTQQVVDAYVDFGESCGQMPSAYQITTLYFTGGRHSSTVDLYNIHPEPPILLTNLVQNIPHISDTTAVQTQSNISWTNYQGQPDGFRQTYWTATFKLNRDLAHFIRRIFDKETAALGHIRGLEARNIMQVITPDMLSHMRRNGGNALGIQNMHEPLILLNPAFRWESSEDDSRVSQSITNFLRRVTQRAKAMGLDVPFKYMNYASQLQDVISSYGAVNQARLLAVARKYDPDGVFQTLQPGYFKLSGRVG